MALRPPPGLGPGLAVEFGLPPRGLASDAPSAYAQPGVLVVRARTRSGVCPARYARGAARMGDTVVVWWREARLDPERACDDLAILAPFEARVRGLGAGTVHVRLDGKHDATEPDDVIHLGPVELK